MARTKNKPTPNSGTGPVEGPEPGPAAPSDVQPSTPEPQRAAFVERNTGEASKGKRLSFPIAEGGGIDWATMQEKPKRNLIDALKADSELRRLLGLGVAESEICFTSKDIEQALGFLNSVNKFSTRIVLSRYKKFNIDPDIMDRVFDNPDPEMHKELVERGTRLANKYSAEWMRKYADEIFFAAIYFKSVSSQVIAAAGMQMARNIALQREAERQAKPNGGVQPHVAASE